MKKDKIARIGLLVLSFLILIGIGLMIYLLFNPSTDDDIIAIDLENNKGKTVEFNNMSLIPGSSSEYTILLTSDVEDEYITTLSFVEIKDHSLKNYAYARICVGEEIICDKLLSDLFESSDLSFTCNLNKNEATEFTITYYMPESVGNEAKNTASDFELKIIASNTEAFHE